LAVQKDPNDTAPPSSAAGRNETNKDSDSSSPPSLEKQVHMPKTAATPLAAKEETDKPATIPFQAIWGRTLDTVEDVVAHVRRIPYDLGWFLETPPGDDRERVIVLGSGWASHALLKVADPYRLAVFVVSPDNHFVFTPMLASAAVGTVEYRSMTEAVRAANPMIENYFQGQAIDVDVEKKLLKVQMNALSDDNGKSPIVQIPYDKLVVAVGCKVADDLVPGAKEFCLRLKTCEDSRQLRDGIGECLESASRPDVTEVDVAGNKNLAESEQERRRKERRRRVTFAIVGGGPTGVELCGELVDFCKDVSKPRVGAYPKLRDDIKVILIHGGPDLVPAFDEELRAHALRSLQKVGVDVRLNTKVIEVGSNFIKVAPKGAQDGQPEVIDVGLTVWAAGTAPVPFVDALLKKLPESARGKGGRINVDEWLRVPTPNKDLFGSILAMGDAVSFVDKVDSFLPQTAQVAGQQGAYAARLLGRGYDLEATPPVLGKDGPMMLNAWMKLRGLEEALGFDFVNLGLLAYVGSGEALTQIQIGDLPILSYAGSISVVLWRSVYFVKQVATRNRILVTFDWLKSAVFGRDITRL
jgi:NADH dehydrogenase FAD-containing subunit